MFNGSNGVINDIFYEAWNCGQTGWIPVQPGLCPCLCNGLPRYGPVWPFAIIIMAALKTIPQDMYEAAAIDGATPLKNLFT